MPADAATSLTALPAHALAARIAAGAVSARDVVEAHLARIAARNPALNAIVTLDAEGARRAADAADRAVDEGRPLGALHGVPVTIKDLLETAGMRTTFGYRRTPAYLPARDATPVARLRAAGAIILGKTNTSELGFDWQTRNPVTGLTRNPWDPGRSAGGSSGGSAAAVAAQLTPLCLGSDLAGSNRVPAHCCGVLSLKPTEHRVSSRGHGSVPDTVSGVRHMSTVGPVARSVADLALALDLIAGPDGEDWDVPPVPLAARAALAAPRRPLRLAWTDELGLPCAAEVRAALAAAAARLAAAGHTVVRTAPGGLDVQELLMLWGHIAGAELGASMPAPLRAVARALLPPLFGSSAWTRALVRGFRVSMRRHALALARRDAILGDLEAWLAGYDAWLVPVAAVPAIPHQPTGRPILVDGARVPYPLALGGFAVPFALTGQPVVVLPLGPGPAGLPIGVQAVGRRWDEAALLATAQRLEAVLGGWQPPPERPRA